MGLLREPFVKVLNLLCSIGTIIASPTTTSTATATTTDIATSTTPPAHVTSTTATSAPGNTTSTSTSTTTSAPENTTSTSTSTTTTTVGWKLPKKLQNPLPANEKSAFWNCVDFISDVIREALIVSFIVVIQELGPQIAKHFEVAARAAGRGAATVVGDAAAYLEWRSSQVYKKAYEQMYSDFIRYREEEEKKCHESNLNGEELSDNISGEFSKRLEAIHSDLMKISYRVAVLEEEERS